MAEINFGNYSQNFDRFLVTFHVAAALLCIVMGCFAVFQDGHYIYLPPIFIIGSGVSCVNVYASLKYSKHKKKKTAKLMAVLYGLLAISLGFVSYFTIKSFWF